jgi:hypothetical protein
MAYMEQLQSGFKPLVQTGGEAGRHNINTRAISSSHLNGTA